MSFTNDVPFKWDEEEDRRLFNSLLSNFSSLSSAMPNNSAQSILENNPLDVLSGNQLGEYQWKTYWSHEIRDFFFGGIKNKVSDPDDPIEVTDETKIYNSLKVDRKAIFYTDNNRNNEFDKGDDFLFEIKIFISTDGAKLQRAWLGAPPKDNELLIFLENNEGDYVSGQRLFSKAGKNVASQIEGYSDNLKIYEWINGIHNISKKDLRLLLASAGTPGLFIRTLKKVLSVTTKVVTWPIEKLADLFFWIGEKIQHNLRIDESTWDGGTDAGKKVGEQRQKVRELFKDFFNDWQHDEPGGIKSKTMPQYEKVIHEVLNGAMKLATDYADAIPEILFAVICGVINGVVDLIASFFTFIGLVLKFIYTSIRDTEDVISSLDYYVTLILEYQDNFIQAIRKVDWQQVIEQAYAAYTNFMYIQLPLLLSQAIEHIAGMEAIKLARQIGYYIGYIGINIVVCFIPVVDLIELTQISKLAKPIQELFEVITKLIRKAGSFVAKNVSEIFSLLEGFIDMLRNGTDEVVNFVKRVFEAIKVWLEELLGIKRVDDLSIEDIDWVQRDAVGNLGGKIVTTKQIKRLRAILSEGGVRLILERKAIHKKYYRDMFYAMRKFNRVGGFNAITKDFILVDNVTEIVVFHELAHFKHWRQLGEVYSSLSTLEKEMYVWEQIYKNKNLWTKLELEDAFRYVNQIRFNEYGLDPLIVKL